MNGTAAESVREKILRNRHPASVRKGPGRQHLLLHFQHFPRLSFICHEKLCSLPLLKVTLQIAKIIKYVVDGLSYSFPIVWVIFLNSKKNSTFWRIFAHCAPVNNNRGFRNVNPYAARETLSKSVGGVKSQGISHYWLCAVKPPWESKCKISWASKVECINCFYSR